MLTAREFAYDGGNIVNLMGSITLGLGGGDAGYGPLRLLEPDEVAAARNVLLLVIDGLGFEFLRRRGAGGVLHEHLRGSMSSVFPTTTAAAITTFATGLAPRRHGLTGWFMWLKEFASIAAVLPFRTRASGFPLPAAAAARVFDQPAVVASLPVQSYMVTHKRIADSLYSMHISKGAVRAAYSDLPDCFAQLHRILSEGQSRQYIHAYWPDFDSLAHEHGVESPEAGRLFEALDRSVAAFLESIRGTDTLVIITADHGFIDTAPDRVISVEDHPVIADALTLPLCGEPRLAYCYVHPARAARFQDYVQERLSEQCTLYESGEFLELGLFGPGAEHPGLRDRIGDYVLVMKDNYVIKDRMPGEHPFDQIGVHGGLSREELYVPLIVAKA